MTERITVAKEGESFSVTEQVTKVAKPKCEQNNGLWFCITHEKTFFNNFEKDGHIHRGKHKLVWICVAHGYETP